MKWTNYPTEADYQKQVNGAEVTGDKWSNGPGPGTVWAIPEGYSDFVLVVTRASVKGGKPYSVARFDQLRARQN